MMFTQERWWNRPGIFVEWYVTSARYTNFLQSWGSVSIDEFRRQKQVCFSVFVWMFFLLWIFGGIHSWGTFMFFCLCGGGLFCVPDYVIQKKIQKRKQTIYQETPYILDVIVLALRSGMNIEQAFVFVSNRMSGTLPQIIRTRLLAMGWGRGFEQSLEPLLQIDIGQDSQHMINTVLQTKHLGVSLADSLSLQSELLRTKRRQQMEELARTASVKISLPLVFCIFPALLLLYLGPALLMLLQQ